MPITQTSARTQSAEASDIGLCAGVWPTSFCFGPFIYTRVEVQRDIRENEILWVKYVRTDGVVLTVYND